MIDETCGSCQFWCGRCMKGKRWPLAFSDACENYKSRPQVPKQILEQYAKQRKALVDSCFKRQLDAQREV